MKCTCVEAGEYHPNPSLYKEISTNSILSSALCSDQSAQPHTSPVVCVLHMAGYVGVLHIAILKDHVRLGNILYN